MKTAKEIISEYGWEKVWTYKMMEEIINTARKEAIEECAKVAKSIPVEYSEEARQRNLCPVKVVAAVDKQSILNLINELK